MIKIHFIILIRFIIGFFGLFLKTEKFNLSEVIDEIVKKYENQNISLDQEKDIFFNGRKNLIVRCLNNLIDNATSFAEKITIKNQKVKRAIIIFVEDNGPGIPESEYENVIKPFYKIDKSRNQKKSSVGLGLSIASDIIRSHGGYIRLNKSKLKGLEVKIFLPV